MGRERAESRGHGSGKRGGETLLHLLCVFVPLCVWLSPKHANIRCIDFS